MVGFKTLTSTICLVTILSLSLGLTARAHANNNNGDDVFVTFEHSATATAGGVHYSPPPPGDPDDWSIKLQIPKTDVPYPFANAILHNFAGPPPATAPSFDFLSNIAGPSGGSPRLVMCFSGAPSCYNKMELRPLAWVANLWTTVDGNGPNWDNRGAGCPTYGLTYTEALACHAGQTVLDVHISTDSSWLATVPPTGYIHYIDNIHYGSAFITSPASGCQESDGNGDFEGDHGKGHFSMDNDGCMDGDQDQVSSSDRGDGRDFQSSQITTSTFDPMANTVTITGVGTSGGVPVAFTFVALETGLTTPGWVSFAFSDGYTNAGTLVNGSVLLH